LTISIVVAVAFIFVARLITAFEPQVSARSARLTLRRAESVQPETDLVFAKRRWPRRRR
jgi:hypothetical protein